MRKVPDPQSKEAELFCKQWDNSDHLGKLTLCEKFGIKYPTGKEFRSNLKDKYPYKGIKYGKKPDKEPIPVLNIPEINLKQYTPKEKSGVDEQQVLVRSDGHAGKITNSYNEDIYKKRLEKLFNKTILIKQLQENSHPVNHLTLLLLGDMVQGENVHQGSQVGDISCGARDQVVKIAFPTNLEFIYSLKQHYSTIDIECWPGNHGNISREAPKTSNWDLMLYDLLKSSLEKQKDIKINIHEDFGSVIKILGHSFFCLHGDGTTTNGGVPWMALSRKISKWYMQFKGFEYVVLGHFHTTAYTEIGRNTDLFMNGAMVSDDDWSLKTMGISSTPTQWTFGVHPRQGVSWQYPLNIE